MIDSSAKNRGAKGSPDRDRLFARLAELGIVSTTVEHEPVFSVEESEGLRTVLPGAHTKNLFLVDKDRNAVLVVAKDDSRVDLKALAKRLESGRLSFGRPELLHEMLGVVPGSVTPFALINDTGVRLRVVVDAALLQHEEVNCHPLQNTATTRLRLADLLRFIEACGHAPLIAPLG